MKHLIKQLHLANLKLMIKIFMDYGLILIDGNLGEIKTMHNQANKYTSISLIKIQIVEYYILQNTP